MKFKKLDEIENYLNKIAWKGIPLYTNHLL